MRFIQLLLFALAIGSLSIACSSSYSKNNSGSVYSIANLSEYDMTEDDILLLYGPPDKKDSSNNFNSWFYQNAGNKTNLTVQFHPNGTVHSLQSNH